MILSGLINTLVHLDLPFLEVLGSTVGTFMRCYFKLETRVANLIRLLSNLFGSFTDLGFHTGEYTNFSFSVWIVNNAVQVSLWTELVSAVPDLPRARSAIKLVITLQQRLLHRSFDDQFFKKHRKSNYNIFELGFDAVVVVIDLFIYFDIPKMNRI